MSVSEVGSGATFTISTGSSSDATSAAARRAERETERLARAGARQFLERVGDLAAAVSNLRQVTASAAERMGERSPARVKSLDALGLEAGALEVPLADSAAFSGVTAGSFVVNDVTITVDPATDSLADVLARVSRSDASATASYGTDDRVHLSSRRGIVLGSDSSGLLDALGIEEGETRSRSQWRRIQREVAQEVKEAVAALAEPLNALWARVTNEDEANAVVEPGREAVEEALRELFGGSNTSWENDFGFEFALSDASDEEDAIQFDATVVDFTTGDLSALVAAIEDDPQAVFGFLLGEGDDPGLLGSLEDAIATARESIGDHYGYSGNLVDRLV